MPPDVTVVVPAMNAEATLGRCLNALSAQDLDGDFEVIVVDDGSTDDTAEVAAAAPGFVRVIRQERAGAAAARNRGVAEAGAPVVAFTDADCFPEPGWLMAGLDAMSRADLVQGAVSPEEGVSRGPFDRTVWVVRESGFYETANLIVRRETVERVGGFEALFPDAGGRPIGEDLWFGWRARRAGAQTAWCEAAHVRHAVFRGTRRAYVTERRRLSMFPEIAARVPEMRDEVFFARLFLSRRSAAFDLAVAGAAAALATRRRAPLAAALPYAWLSASEAARWRKRAPDQLVTALAADVVGAAALAWGSLRSRSPLL